MTSGRRSSVAQDVGVHREPFASIDRALSDGEYFWRVRAVDKRGRAGRWSEARSFKKTWGTPPTLLAPGDDASVSYPGQTLLMRWTPVPRAYKYRVEIATDPEMAHSALPYRIPSIETSGTSFVLAVPLAPDTYYWAITPLDADKHYGQRSEIRKFTWHWPSGLNEATQMNVQDLDGSAEVFDPQLNWAPIPGASSYQVEISMAVSDGRADNSFPAGSIVCCSGTVTGTSLSPAKLLAEQHPGGDPGELGYRWRVRGLDPDGHPGAWNYGQQFDQRYPASIPNLHVRDNLSDTPTDVDPSTEVIDTSAPAIVWKQVPGASSYEVQVVPYVNVPGTSVSVCNWSSARRWNVVTATTGWTPLGPSTTSKPFGVLTNMTASADSGAQPQSGTSYCARVKARRDRDAKNKEIVSDWTNINGGTQPAFRFVAPPAPSGATLAMSAGDYVSPVGRSCTAGCRRCSRGSPSTVRAATSSSSRGTSSSRRSSTWRSRTWLSYAPRRNKLPRTYRTRPTRTGGRWCRRHWRTATSPRRRRPTAPRSDSASSRRARGAGPTGGQTVVALQPTFRWRPTLGARSYTLQVAQDPSFGRPILSVVTASSSYTPIATLPADATLYWRVRANDEVDTGLSWSDTAAFVRQLPRAVPAMNNPSAAMRSRSCRGRRCREPSRTTSISSRPTAPSAPSRCGRPPSPPSGSTEPGSGAGRFVPTSGSG